MPRRHTQGCVDMGFDAVDSKPGHCRLVQVGHSATFRSLLSLNVTIIAYNSMKAMSNGLIYMPDEMQILVREYSTSSNGAVPYYLAASILAIFFSTLQLSCLPIVYLISGHLMPQHGVLLEVATHFFNHCAAYWLSFIMTAVSPSGVYAGSLGRCGWRERSEGTPQYRYQQVVMHGVCM